MEPIYLLPISAPQSQRSGAQTSAKLPRLVADVAHQRDGTSKSRANILGINAHRLEVGFDSGKIVRIDTSFLRTFAQMEVAPKRPVERTRNFNLRPQPVETKHW